MPEATLEMPSTMTATAREIQTTVANAATQDAGDHIEKAFNEALGNGADTKPGVDARVKPAAATDPVAEQTKGMSEKASANFKKIHARAASAESRAKFLEGEIAKLKTGSPNGNVAEFDRIKKEHAAFDAELKKLALERHPKFRDAYDGEIERQLAAAKGIVGEKYAKDIAAVLEKRDDAKWQELQTELGAFTSSQLAVIASNIQKLKADKGAELENWKANSESLAQYEQAQQAAAAEARAKELSRAADEAIAKAQENFDIFRMADDNDEWNREVEGRLNQVREWATSDLSPQDRARLAVRAAGADKYLALFKGASRLAHHYKAQVDKYKAANPHIGGAADPVNHGLPDEMDYAEAVSRSLTDMGALRTS